jgi:hypothetical protein
MGMKIGDNLLHNTKKFGIPVPDAQKGDADANIIKLSMVIDPELQKQDKSDIFYPFWTYNSLKLSDIRKINESGISLLKKKGEILSLKNNVIL